MWHGEQRHSLNFAITDHLQEYLYLKSCVIWSLPLSPFGTPGRVTVCLIARLPALAYLTEMMRESDAHSKLGDGNPSSTPDLIPEEIQPNQSEEEREMGESTVTEQAKGGSDPEKAVHTYNNVKEGTVGTSASKDAPNLPEPAANPASNGVFGEEDNEYISGYKLYVALFGIVSVFFLVLLDFSITATVSAGSF